MPSVYKLNPNALRVSIRLREGFGWYPTDKDDEDQLKMFEDSVSRLKAALKTSDDTITPSNMRKSFTLLNNICEREADVLWDINFLGDHSKVSPENPVTSDQLKYPSLFDTREACLSYAYAIAFALEACFDTYLRQQRNATTQPAAPREVRSRSNGRGYDRDNFDFDGHLVAPSTSPRRVASNVYGGGYEQHRDLHHDQRGAYPPYEHRYDTRYERSERGGRGGRGGRY